MDGAINVFCHSEYYSFFCGFPYQWAGGNDGDQGFGGEVLGLDICGQDSGERRECRGRGWGGHWWDNGGGRWQEGLHRRE